MPNRIQLTDSVVDIVGKLSEGNPGAISVLVQWLTKGPTIDPQAMHPMLGMCMLDDLDIVASKIWVLYKDVCGEDIRVFIGVLRAYQLGFLSKEDLKNASYEHPLDTAALLAQVEERLPEFQRTLPPAHIV